MSEESAFRPDWVSPPGHTVADILRERHYSLAEFARRMGYTPNEVEELLKSRVRISSETARKLELVLGATADFWMMREAQYRGTVIRQREEVWTKSQEDWLNQLPLRDMRKHGWVEPHLLATDPLAACLRFFAVADVEAWQRTYRDLLDRVTFRTSQVFDSRPAAVATWLRQGEIQSGSIECKPWDPNGLRSVLSELRVLTRKRDPKLFLPELTRRCAEFGVAVAVVRAPSGCRASGATRFLSSNKALLLLSFRYLSDDHFWFTFFHEAAHLLLHSKKALFLEGSKISNVEEDEANEFSANVLVPPEFQGKLATLRVDRREVRFFAKAAGVSPGIIVGQLQYSGRAGRNQLNTLKARFDWGSDSD